MSMRTQYTTCIGWGLALSAVLGHSGCGPSPSETTQSKGPSVATVEAKLTDAERAAAHGKITDQAIEPAPQVPSFKPGQTDPAIAKKAYMNLALGKTSDPAELIGFLTKSNAATRELMADVSRKQITQELGFDRGMLLAREKLAASERLAAVPSNPPNETYRVAAMRGKMEALGLMAQFRDLGALDSLRAFVDVAKKDLSPQVAQPAKSMSLDLALSDYEGGGTDVRAIITECNELLGDGKNVTELNLRSLAQAVFALDSHSQTTDANALANKIEELFRNSANRQLSSGAWQLKASRLPEMQTFQTMMEGDLTALEVDKLKASLDVVVEQLPSLWTAKFLVQRSVNVEYSGNAECAKRMVSAAELLAEKETDPSSTEELKTLFDQFHRRTGVVGKSLPISDLLDSNGKPFDWSQYQGKVVLIDFWATWCTPCLQEIPNIKETYVAKHDQGFEVISVNLDQERSALDGFLAKEKLPWTTYVSSDPEKLGFDTPLAAQLGIVAIPFILIIDRQGNVADVHVRGRKLEARIAELLSMPASKE